MCVCPSMMARNDSKKFENLDEYNFKVCPDAFEAQIFNFFVISRGIKSKIIEKNGITSKRRHIFTVCTFAS